MQTTTDSEVANDWGFFPESTLSLHLTGLIS